MKRLLIASYIVIQIILLSCNKISKPYKDMVFIAAAEVSVNAVLTVDNTGGEMAISVKASEPVDHDIIIALGTDTSLIAAYNEKNRKKYSALPNGSYRLSNAEVTIAAGSTISNPVKLQITSVNDFKDGSAYIMPVSISKSSGLPVLEASKTLYVEVKRTIYAAVASLKNNYFSVDFSSNNNALKAMTSVTYETRIMFNNFQSVSPFISSIMGIEENFLFRFGDVTVKPNQLQMAGGSTATNVPMEFATGKWYHLAGVYDGAKLQIYVDGQLVATKVAARTMDLTNGFYFGYSAGGRLADAYISEARVWSRTLTPAELINGMCGIDPASPALEGYWKFNEGSGNVAHDVSGHSHDATANKSVVWIPNVKCG